MSDGAVVVKTRKFKRNPLLARRQVCRLAKPKVSSRRVASRRPLRQTVRSSSICRSSEQFELELLALALNGTSSVAIDEVQQQTWIVE